jgi:hypothetical protein
VSDLVMLIIAAYEFPPGMSEKKQTSYKVLMGLIVLMFVLQTIHSACEWYITWLGFIYYSDTPDQALNALLAIPTNRPLLITVLMADLLTTLRLAIADSIMASIRVLLPGSTANSL